jgi:D-alanyl-D-alanine carboxypeptidase
MRSDSVFTLRLATIVLTLCFSWGLTNNARAAQFSSIVIDASTGRTLHQYRANQQRYPASLAKMMTLYMMFEEIESGRMKPNTKIRVSRNAARQPASKLGLRTRSTITARMAMQSLIVKSANDVATAVAEHIAGSEAKFARRMTGKARQLGLYDTRFTNASGLYHWRQQTTARDMARLANLLLNRFPHFETVWRLREFDYRGKTYISHNRLLSRLYGAMGMKTGYIRASGYNLATAVQRDGKRVIIVVLGSDSPQTRDRRVTSLAERSLARAVPMPTPSIAAAKLQRAAQWLDRPADALLSQAGETGDRQDWKIQVGAFSASNHARSQLQRVRRVLGTHLEMAEESTEPFEKNGKRIYRARFANLSEPQAFSLCDRLRDVTPNCLPIGP